MNRIDWHGLCGSRRKPFAEMLFSRLLGTLRVSRRVFRPLQSVCSEEIQSDHIVRNISFLRAPGIVLGLVEVLGLRLGLGRGLALGFGVLGLLGL